MSGESVRTMLPAGWKTSRIKWLTSQTSGLFTDGDWIEAPFITSEGIRLIQTGNIGVGAYKDQGFRFINEASFAQLHCTEVRPNDILICRLADPVGRACLAPANLGPMITSVDVAILRARRDLDPRYYVYFFSSQAYLEWLGTICRGSTRDRISRRMLGDITVPEPPLSEQRAIADFLDQETVAIDALVANRARFIELLNEKSKAQITYAVTKGLDPKARMKVSNEKWLGEIPAHWDVVPSNRIFVESKQKAREGDEHLSATQAYGVIPLAEFERLESRQVTHAEKNLEQRKHVEVGNFVISMRSFEGGIEQVKARGCVRSSYIALVPDGKAHVGFFSYLFKSSAYIQGLQATAMFIRDGQDLSYHNFRQIKLPLPRIEEQARIAQFLDREVSKSSVLKAKTEEANRKLLEYRSALISAAVSGQIDVRNYRREGAAVACP